MNRLSTLPWGIFSSEGKGKTDNKNFSMKFSLMLGVNVFLLFTMGNVLKHVSRCSWVNDDFLVILK